MADSSRSDYKFIRLWSQLAPRISPPPKELRVWIWYRNNVLAHQELREKFLSKSPQGLIVSHLLMEILMLTGLGKREKGDLAMCHAKRWQSDVSRFIPGDFEDASLQPPTSCPPVHYSFDRPWPGRQVPHQAI